METKISVDGNQVYNCNDKYLLANKEYIVNELPFKPLSSIGVVTNSAFGPFITVDIEQFFGQNAEYHYYSDKFYAMFTIEGGPHSITYGNVGEFVSRSGGKSWDMHVICVNSSYITAVTLIFCFGIELFTLADDGTKSRKFIEFANNTNTLTKYNKEKYTPTNDYHPATKKYVDDSIVLTSANPGTSLYLKSPDESTFKVTVDNDGNLSATKV